MITLNSIGCCLLMLSLNQELSCAAFDLIFKMGCQDGADNRKK
jgi:hypothetical protein